MTDDKIQDFMDAQEDGCIFLKAGEEFGKWWITGLDDMETLTLLMNAYLEFTQSVNEEVLKELLDTATLMEGTADEVIH